MAALQHKLSSYFDLPLGTPQTPDSREDVSPFTVPAAAALHEKRGRRPRLRDATPSRSEDAFLRSPVQTIPEDDSSHHSYGHAGRLKPVSDALQLADVDKHRNRSSTRKTSSRWSSVDVVEDKRLRINHISQSEGSSDEAGVGVEIHSRMSKPLWAQSFKRHSSSDRPTSGGSSTASFREVFRALHTTERTPPPIQPLRPPSVATKAEPLLDGKIRVEESFPEKTSSASNAVSPKAASPGMNLVNPRQLFSFGLDTFRKLRGKHEHENLLATEQRYRHDNLQIPASRDHLTNLRKHETANILLRATSMLQEVKNHAHSTLHAKQTTATPTKLQNRHRAGDRSKSPPPLARVRSMEVSIEDTESQSSSLRRLKMGQTPYNTPDDQAKYTIINQVGELEEFLKVDISVRGCTSYLPSEARRIHTPPLPGEDNAGKRRGFFFDYNLPFNQMRTSTHVDAHPGKLDTIGQEAAIDDMPPTSSAPVNQQAVSAKVKNNGRVKACEWYDTQLAKLDSLDDTETSDNMPVPASSIDQSEASSFPAKPQQVFDEARLDYNIPEHYPTSPLCPRHPRYWRVIKNKGNQFRGCWMHGYGEFSDSEKARYGIVTKTSI